MKPLFLLVLIISIIAPGCGTTKVITEPTANGSGFNTHNSMNSLDWSGTYRGLIPCADCEGILTIVQLNDDLSYEITAKYLGDDPMEIKNNGTFNWDETGNNIVLQNVDPRLETNMYQVAENALIKLDTNGKKIEGELADKYVLKKDI